MNPIQNQKLVFIQGWSAKFIPKTPVTKVIGRKIVATMESFCITRFIWLETCERRPAYSRSGPGIRPASG